MRSAALLATFLLIAFAPSAMAHGGVNLYWDGCLADPAHATTKSWACDSNTGPTFDLYGSIVMPIDVARLGGVEFLVDFEVTRQSGDALAPWWLTHTGQCRAGAIALGYDSSVVPLVTACDELWGGRPLLSTWGIYNYYNGYFFRLTGGIGVPAGSEFAVPADGRELNVFMLRISRAKSTGSGACTGCSYGACIVLNQIRTNIPGGGDFSVNFPAVSNFVTWQTGEPTCPQATPAINRTWGAVKGLYR